MSTHPSSRPAPPAGEFPSATAGSPLSRRQFLTRAALAGGAAAVPLIVPASVLGRDGAVPPSEKIVLGGIGIGNRGSDDLRWMLPEKDVQFVAIAIRRRPAARP